MDKFLTWLASHGYDVLEIGTVNRTDATGVVAEITDRDGATFTLIITEPVDADPKPHPGVPASLYMRPVPLAEPVGGPLEIPRPIEIPATLKSPDFNKTSHHEMTGEFWP